MNKNKLECVRWTLLGVLIALALVAVFRPGESDAKAQGLIGGPAVVGGDDYQIFATNNGKDLPVLFIVDMKTRRFAYYTQVNASQPQNFRLYVVRHFAPDLEFNDLSSKGVTGITVRDVGREKRN